MNKSKVIGYLRPFTYFLLETSKNPAHRVSSGGLRTRNFLSAARFGFRITTGYFFLKSSIMSRSAESSDIIVPREVVRTLLDQNYLGNNSSRSLLNHFLPFGGWKSVKVRLPLAEIRSDNFKVVIRFKKIKSDTQEGMRGCRVARINTPRGARFAFPPVIFYTSPLISIQRSFS